MIQEMFHKFITLFIAGSSLFATTGFTITTHLCSMSSKVMASAETSSMCCPMDEVPSAIPSQLPSGASVIAHRNSCCTFSTTTHKVDEPAVENISAARAQFCLSAITESLAPPSHPPVAEQAIWIASHISESPPLFLQDRSLRI